MPVVPSYTPGQIENEPARLPRRQSPVDARVLATPGLALAQAGSTLGQIAVLEQRKAADTQVLGGNRALSQVEIDLWDNPQTGGSTKKGKDALGLPDSILPEFDKKRAEIEAGMNGEAKARFAAIADGRRQDLQRKVFDHVSRQSDALNLAETEANAQQSLTEVAVNWRDPQRVEAATDLGWAGQFARMSREGSPPEAIKVAREKWEGDVKGTVLDQMIANRDPTAVEFYQQNRAALGVKSDEYAKQIDQLQLQINETKETDRIVGRFGSGPAAIAEARNILDPVLRERVENRIDREQVRLDRARTEADKQIRDTAWNVVGQLPPGVPIESVLSPKQIVGINQVPGLRAELDREVDGKLKGTETKTVPATYERLQTMAPNDFAKVDLSKYNGELSPGDRDYFAKRQKEAQDPSKQAQFATENQQLDLVYGDLGIPAGTKGEAKRTAFDKAYREELRGWIANSKREPTAEERKKIMDSLMLPFVKERPWYQGGDVEKRNFQIPSTETKGFRPVVPDDARARYLERAKARKRSLSEAEIERLYLLEQGQ